MKIQPIGYRSLIRHIREGKTGGGLILPENVTEKGVLGRGEIVAVGRSKWLKEGDKVYFMRTAVDELEVDGELFSIVRNKFIYAKYE